MQSYIIIRTPDSPFKAVVIIYILYIIHRNIHMHTYNIIQQREGSSWNSE